MGLDMYMFGIKDLDIKNKLNNKYKEYYELNLDILDKIIKSESFKLFKSFFKNDINLEIEDLDENIAYKISITLLYKNKAKIYFTNIFSFISWEKLKESEKIAYKMIEWILSDFKVDEELKTNLNKLKSILDKVEKLKQLENEEIIFYVRKFNALHNFIIQKYGKGEDKGQEISLTIENLKEILKVLKEAKQAFENEDFNKCKKLLPPKDGFFFGSLKIDEFYYNDLKDSIEQIIKIIDSYNKFEVVYYQADW